jgi:hypothetical protein
MRAVITLMFGLILVSVRIILGDKVDDIYIISINAVINAFILFYTILIIGISSWLDIKRLCKKHNDSCIDEKLLRYGWIVFGVSMATLVSSVIYIVVVRSGKICDIACITNDVLSIVALCTSIETSYLQKKLTHIFC